MYLTYLDWDNVKFCWSTAGDQYLHVVLFRPQPTWTTS